ncbi:AlpA family phage regulatory protein [Oxalobacteraceae bacterium OM1]|nr:AlpA family phage regulatory protein [Oxalobacteraceae bacterium OM1]
MSKRILKLHEVEARVGLKKTFIYKAIQAGTFPRPISLGGTARGWVDAEIEKWIDERIAAADTALGKHQSWMQRKPTAPAPSSKEDM